MITTISNRSAVSSNVARTAVARFFNIGELGTLVYRFSLGIMAVALLIYGYFIAATVVDVITRAHYEKLSATLGDQVNGLESTYLAKSSEITRDRAVAQGYGEAKATLFARVDGSSDRLAFVPHEVR